MLNSYRDLRVYQKAMESAVDIFILTKDFPSHEKYSLVDQIRRCSRSVCANLAEVWRKRRYKAAFIAKLSDAETEAGETQVWLEFAYRFGYLKLEQEQERRLTYDNIIGQLVRMIEQADHFLIRS